MSKSVEAIIWDMDGTLINSKRAHPYAYIAAVKTGGGPTYSTDDVIARYSLGPVTAILTDLLRRQCTHQDVDNYHRELEQTAHMATVYEGIEDAIHSFHSAGLQQLLFTGGDTYAAELLLNGLGLRKHLEVVVGGDQIENPKPAPDGVLLACSLANVSSTDAVYIGDHPYDLQAARAAGAVPIAAGWGHMYNAAAATQFADFVAATPSEVVSFLELEDEDLFAGSDPENE